MTRMQDRQKASETDTHKVKRLQEILSIICYYDFLRFGSEDLVRSIMKDVDYEDQDIKEMRTKQIL